MAKRARRNFWRSKKSKAPTEAVYSLKYEVWQDGFPQRKSKRVAEGDLSAWYFDLTEQPGVQGVRIKSASGPGGMARVAQLLGVSQGALNNPGYAIPPEYPRSDYTWGPDPRMANWTSYPTYSYEQFARANPQEQEVAFMGASRSLQPRREVGADDIYLGSDKVGYVERVPWDGGSHRLAVYLVDPGSDFSIQYMTTVKPAEYHEFMRAWWGVYGSRVLSQGFGGQAIGRANPRRRRSHRVTRIYFWGPSYEQSDVFIADNRPGWEDAYDRMAAVSGEASGFIEVAGSRNNPKKFAPNPFAGVPTPYQMPDNAGPYLPEMYPYGVGGRPATYKIAKKNRGPRGGYSESEREALPSSDFLKPPTRSWPVSDREHAEIAIQYMTRGFGQPAEYPMLIQRLALVWSPEDQANRSIWTYYRRNKEKIEAKAKAPMPSVAELRQYAVHRMSRPAVANPAGQLWVAPEYRGAGAPQSESEYLAVRQAPNSGKHPVLGYYTSFGNRKLRELIQRGDQLAKWEYDYRTSRGGGAHGFRTRR